MFLGMGASHLRDPYETHDIGSIQHLAGGSNTILVSAIDHQIVVNEIDKTNQEIDVLDEELARLHAIRNSKLAKVDVLQIVIAPHKKLPTEVLGIIFGYTLSTEESSRKALHLPGGLTHRTSPWNLRQVCSTWRKVAVSHIALWNKIRIIQSGKIDPKGTAFTRNLDIANELLPRIGPIHLELSVQDETLNTIDLIHRFFLHLVVPRRLQVASLKLKARCGCYSAFEALYMEDGLLDLPSLETLRMICEAHEGAEQEELEDADYIFSDPRRLEKARRLKNMQFLGDAPVMAYAFQFIASPWAASRLTSLNLDYRTVFPNSPIETSITWAQFCSVLRRSTKLTELTLRLCGPIDQSIEAEHVTLPELTSLTLFTPISVLDSFTLPKLSHFTYRAGSSFHILEMVKLIKRSKCELKTFIEESRPKKPIPNAVPVKRAEWDELVRLLRSVEELRTDTIFKKPDMARLGLGEILPCVEILDIPVDDIVGAFAKIASRVVGFGTKGGPNKLRRVCIHYSRDQYWEKMAQLPSFKEIKAMAEQCGSVIQFKPIDYDKPRRRVI